MFDLKDWLRTRNRKRVYGRRLKKPCSAHPDGFLFSGRHQVMVKGAYEPFEADLVKKILNEVQLFVNIGANYGYYSCLALSLQTDTIAFEPEATNIKMIRKHIAANNFKNNFTLHPCAVGSRSDELTLHGGGSGGSLLKDNLNGAPKGEKQKVSVVTLDDTLVLSSNKTLCLMDIEGFEYDALMGCKTILSCANQPYWIIEVWPRNNKNEPNPNFSQVFSLMSLHGYAYWGIDEHNKILTALNADMVKCIQLGEAQVEYSNFLFIPNHDDLFLRMGF